jgi:hypothetical protein
MNLGSRRNHMKRFECASFENLYGARCTLRLYTVRKSDKFRETLCDQFWLHTEFYPAFLVLETVWWVDKSHCNLGVALSNFNPPPALVLGRSVPLGNTRAALLDSRRMDQVVPEWRSLPLECKKHILMFLPFQNAIR